MTTPSQPEQSIALLQDPANQRLNRKLLTAHQRQLNLLQRATQIAVRGSRSSTI